MNTERKKAFVSVFALKTDIVTKQKERKLHHSFLSFI